MCHWCAFAGEPCGRCLAAEEQRNAPRSDAEEARLDRTERWHYPPGWRDAP